MLLQSIPIRLADPTTRSPETLIETHHVDSHSLTIWKSSPGPNSGSNNHMSKATILIIEDERALVDVLTYNLRKEGFEVHSATDGQDGLLRAQRTLPDLIILDLMLPVIDGLEVCRVIKSGARTCEIPLLILTARCEEEDEVLGFQNGADDYVAKPFKVKPLIERVKALLRRKSSVSAEGEIVVGGGIEMNRTQHRATVNNNELNVTPTEFRLLWALVRQPGRTFSRNELMEAVMGDNAIVLERTIDVHIKSLREKLGTKSNQIETVRGVGYRFLE
jgi:two-component system phosphate regulon response regulator PhoB